MIYQFRVAYNTHRWVRAATSITLLVYVIALYWLSGGFPPWAWRILFQVVPTLPRLWAMQGFAFVFPFIVLTLYSLSLLILWGVLLLSFVNMVLHWWQGKQKRQTSGPGMQQVAQETSRRAITTTGGRTRRPPSSAPLPMASNTGRSPLPARNNPNGQLTQTRSSVLPQSQPALLSAGYQNRDQREQAERSPDVVRPWPVLSPQLFYERTSNSQFGGKSIADNNDEMVPAFFIPSYAAYSRERAPMQWSNTVRLMVSAESDAGRVRSRLPNEDSILAVQETRVTEARQFPVGLFIVADGMGGHADGQQASQLVIQVMRETILPVLRSSESDEKICADMLYVGVQRANSTLYQHNQQRHAMMGTTMTSAIVFGTSVHIVSVGDSRTYRPSKGLAQITRDHSIVAELAAVGIIAPEEIYTHPKRNEVTRCLGSNAEVEIDTFMEPLQVGDVLLLCSDGLWEMVRDPDIEELVAPFPRDAQHLSELLIQAALNRGGKDNVSVIAVEIASAV